MISAFYRFLICFFLVLLTAYTVKAQMRAFGRKLKKIDCPIENGSDLNFSLGIKVGDPYGLTAKLYFPGRWALEAVVGRTFPGIHDEAGEDVFNEEIELPHDEQEYLGHEVRKLCATQFRFVYHGDFQGYNGLDWYAAIGAQARFYEIHYVYEYTDYNPISSSVTAYDDAYLAVGPEVTIGVEYVIPYRSLSSFAEVGFFTDVANEQLNTLFFGGLGVRYNF